MKKRSKKSSAELKNLPKINKFLKVVSDENRLKILLALKNDTMNVTQIHSKLKLPQNLTSHHLSKLKKIGLLDEKHEGTFRHYSINVKKIREFNNLFRDMFGI
jgi:ArsR family transcriptional regulator, arsenate/arsenite/antimonite-responsive transcriptional repressor